MLGARKYFCSMTLSVKCKSEIVKGTKVGPAALKEQFKYICALVATLGDILRILQQVCDEIAAMEQCF